MIIINSSTGEACTLLKSGKYDEAIIMFKSHYETLKSKRQLCLNDKRKLDALDSSLISLESYLSESRKLSLNNSIAKLKPISENLEDMLKSYEEVVRDTLRGMLSYPLPGVTYKNTAGLKGAEDALYQSLLSPLQNGSLYQSEESKSTGIFLELSMDGLYNNTLRSGRTPS